jgi:hypothetical protein
MIGLVAVVGGILGGWTVVAFMLATLIGRAIRIADEKAGAHGMAELPERAA